MVDFSSLRCILNVIQILSMKEVPGEIMLFVWKKVESKFLKRRRNP